MVELWGGGGGGVVVLNATFNNISDILWQSVLLVAETEISVSAITFNRYAHNQKIQKTNNFVVKSVDTSKPMGLTSIDLNRLLLPMVTYEKYAYFQSCTHQC